MASAKIHFGSLKKTLYCAVVGVITNYMHFMKLDCWSRLSRDQQWLQIF